MPKYKKSKDKKQDKRIKKLENLVGGVDVKQIGILTNTLVACTTALAWYPIFQMTTGTTYQNRVGYRISPLEVEIHWEFQNTSTTLVHHARLLMFRVKSQNGAVPSDVEVIDGAAAGVIPFGGINYALAVSKRDSKRGIHTDGSCELLYDSGAIPLSPVNTAVSIDTGFYRTLNIKKRVDMKKEITFSSTTLVSDTNYQIYFVTVADSADVQERGGYFGRYIDL